MNQKFLTTKSTIGNRKSQIPSLIYPFIHSLINSFTFLCKTKPISTVALVESGVIYAKKTTKYYEILQNNPKKYSQKSLFLITFSTLFPSFSITFTRFSALFVMFCKYLKLTHLTPYTTKTYIKIHPDSPILIHSFTHSPINTFMQNEPNSSSTSKRRETRDERLATIKYAKQTQLQKLMCLKAPKTYVPEGTKTNPITILQIN